MTDHPFATVVVPVHEDPERLDLLLTSVAALDWPREALQVVVGIDGPHAPTEEVVRRHGWTAVVLPVNGGSYAARNAALEQLDDRAELVAFTDSDCEVEPGWLRGHHAALQQVALSGGAIDVTLRRRASPAEFVDRRRHLRQQLYVEQDHYAATANLAVRRQVVDEQRFDATMRSGGDADFCLRAQARGHVLAYTAAAVVRHPARQTTRELMTKVERICGGIRSNPERWRDRAIKEPRLTLSIARAAYRQGVTRNPVWMLRAVLLDHRISRRTYRTAQQVKASLR